MREILFRGKRTDNGEWVYGSLITERNMFDGNLMTMHIQDIEEPYNDNLIDDETVGQYTGLTDKNGTKIFEGDIIRFVYPFNEEDVIYVGDVRYFIGGYAVYGISEYNHFFDVCTLAVRGCCEIEVIGNVHDNPELLQD